MTIYGDIPAGDVVLGIGHYNSVTALLNHSMELIDLRTEPILFRLEYVDGGFTLRTTDGKYLGIEMVEQFRQPLALASLVDDRTVLQVEWSAVDATPRQSLLAGALSIFKTKLGDRDWTVHWRTPGLLPGDTILVIPTTWYDSSGQPHTELPPWHTDFRGYTSLQWSQDAPTVRYCADGAYCGECLGYCRDPQQLCSVTPNGLTCVGAVTAVPTATNIVVSSNWISLIAVISVIVLVILIVWGVSSLR